MKISEIVNRDVITVTRATNLRELLKIFSKFHSFPIIPVLDKNENFLGVVTLEGIIEQFSPISTQLGKFFKYAMDGHSKIRELFELDIPTDAGTLFLADDLMTKKVITISQDKDIFDAERIMEQNRVDVLPVLDGKKFVGLISKFDIILGILRQKGII